MPYQSHTYNWNYLTVEPPVAGGLRLNQSDQTTATLLWISHTDSTGTDVAAFMAGLVEGDSVSLRNNADATSHQWYFVTGPPVDKDTYSEIPVLWRAGGTPLAHARILIRVLLLSWSTFTGSAYATVDDLAAALRSQVTVKNRDLLTSCLEAAASEIDHALGRFELDPIVDPAPALVRQVNVARGVEWFKASDAVFGGVGFADTGILRVPADSFARHAATLIPLTQTYGIA